METHKPYIRHNILPCEEDGPKQKQYYQEPGQNAISASCEQTTANMLEHTDAMPISFESILIRRRVSKNPSESYGHVMMVVVVFVIVSSFPTQAYSADFPQFYGSPSWQVRGHLSSYRTSRNLEDYCSIQQNLTTKNAQEFELFDSVFREVPEIVSTLFQENYSHLKEPSWNLLSLTKKANWCVTASSVTECGQNKLETSECERNEFSLSYEFGKRILFEVPIGDFPSRSSAHESFSRGNGKSLHKDSLEPHSVAIDPEDSVFHLPTVLMDDL